MSCRHSIRGGDSNLDQRAMSVGDHAYKFWSYLAAAGAAAVVFGAGLFIVTTLPPRELVMTTGAEGGANHELGIRYREILAKEGVTLRLLPTSGSMENLRLLRNPRSGATLDLYRVAPQQGRKLQS